MKNISGMVLDMNGPIWVELTFDPHGHETKVVVRTEKDGNMLASGGYIGIGAGAYYNRLSKYFFGE